MRKAIDMAKNDINLEYDRETGEYYAIWSPLVIAAGKTITKALEDLRKTAHFSTNTSIELKLKEISVRKET
jgi:predicted RNase H-like HicB family nuclease